MLASLFSTEFSVDDVKPSAGLPFFKWVKELTGDVMGVALMICIILLVVAAGAWIVGRVTGSGTTQKVGISGVIIAAAGAIIIGSAPAIIDWSQKENVIGAPASIEAPVVPGIVTETAAA